MDPLVSIIIPVHNQVGYLLSCLRSIAKAESKTTYEVIVIDDQSSEESAHELDQIPEVRLIRNFKNLGFLRSCNRAALLAKGQYVYFLNSDTEVTDRWLDELVDVYNRFPNVGLVGSKLIYPNGSLQECGGIIWNDATGCNFGRGEDRNRSQYNYTKEVDYVSGASLLIEKSLFIECGLFDYRFAPAYYEDTDLAFKVRSLGKCVFLEPKSVVIHHEGISNGTDGNAGVKKHQKINRDTFLKKWKTELETNHVSPGSNFLDTRERGLNRKRILVIDHYVPPYDRDAGSRCIYMYLKLLRELGLSVTFLPNNFHNPQPYTSDLERLGIEILYGPFHRGKINVWLDEYAAQFDFVFLSRPNIAVKYVEYLKENTNAKLLFFGHDIHHLRLQREQELLGTVSETEIQTAKKEEETVWDLCDALLYPSQEEVHYIEKKHGHSCVVEVPIFFYEKPTQTELPSFNERTGILFVANFNHPPNRDGLHWFFKEVYPALSPIPVFVVGSAIPEEIRSYESETVKIRSDVSDAELQEHYKTCRIAIAPLRFGAGVKGKVLESLYHQLPIVTTRYGAQGIPGLEKAALIADSAEAFSKSCRSLYENETQWLSFQKETVNVLLEKYSYANAKQILETLLFAEEG